MSLRSSAYRALWTLTRQNRRKMYSNHTNVSTHILQFLLELPLQYIKGSMITVSEEAAEAVGRISKEEGLEGQWLRLRIIGGGCAGFSYDLYFEPTITDMDETFESNGIKLCCDPLSYQYLEGTEIQYVDSGISGAGFKFVNPNVTSTCGCGSSFSA